MELLRVGIIGCGVISSVHLPIVSELENLVAVCDIDEVKGKKIADIYNCRYYKNYEEMLKKENLDVIHILTPHNIRYEIVEKAIEFKTNVIIEKPLAHTYEEAEKIVNLINNQNKIKATVVYQNRKNDSYIQLKKELKEEKFGKVLGMEATVFWKRDIDYYKDSPWRGKKSESGGGLLINQAIHTIDWMQDIGGDISTLSGKVFKLKNKELDIEDTCSFSILFSNGVEGFFSGTLTNFKNSSIMLNIYCGRGMYSLRDKSLYKKEYTNNIEKKIITDEVGAVKDYYGTSHKKIVENFYSSIKNSTSNYLPLEEGLKSLKIITDLYKEDNNL